MKKKRKSPRQVLESLKSIRRCPISIEQIERFNRIVDQDNQNEREKTMRKIARSPEAEL
jgi:hypothetical protein